MATNTVKGDNSGELENTIGRGLVGEFGHEPTLSSKAHRSGRPPEARTGENSLPQFVDIQQDQSRGSCQNEFPTENINKTSHDFNVMHGTVGLSMEGDVLTSIEALKRNMTDSDSVFTDRGPTAQNHMTSLKTLDRDREIETTSTGTCQFGLGASASTDSPMGVYMGSPSHVDCPTVTGSHLSNSNLDITGAQSSAYKYNHHQNCGYVTVTAHDDNIRNPALNAMETISPVMSEMQMSDVSSTDYISMSDKLDSVLPSSSFDQIDADIVDFSLSETMDPQSLTSLSDLGQDSQDLLNMTATGEHPLLHMYSESDFASVTTSQTVHSENSNGIATPDTHSVYANSEPDLDENKEPLSYELQQGFRILREIMTESNKSINWPFMNAIDASQEGCENYYEFVKQPMWLKKMKEKFDKRNYVTITEFVADMRIMLENCYRFNGPDHPISKKGQRLETMMEQKLALLSRNLREKTSIAATSGKPAEEKKITGTRRRKAIVPHDSTALLNQLRLEAQERERETRRMMIQERKQAMNAYQHELSSWEDQLFEGGFREQMKHMWELPQIGHFLFLCAIPMNIGEVVQWELERCFLVPRESSTMQRIMTALLSTPYQRTRLDRKPMMPYKVWEDKLRTRLRNWYKVLNDFGRDVKKTTIKLGLEDKFFQVLGLRSPLEKKKYHELSYYQRVWAVKGLCDWCLETQDSIHEAVESQPLTEQRSYDLGTDADGFSYHHFPQFCGADLRIYKQAHVKMGKRDIQAWERNRSPKKIASKKKRPLPRKKETPVKTKEFSAPCTPRSRDSRLRQNPRQTSQFQVADSETEDDFDTSTQKGSVFDTTSDPDSDQESSGKDSGISEESGNDESPPKAARSSDDRAGWGTDDVNLDVLIETAPSRLTRSAMRNLSKVFSTNVTPSASRESSPCNQTQRYRGRRKKCSNKNWLMASRDSTPSTRGDARSREISPLSDCDRTAAKTELGRNSVKLGDQLSRHSDDNSQTTGHNNSDLPDLKVKIQPSDLIADDDNTKDNDTKLEDIESLENRDVRKKSAGNESEMEPETQDSGPIWHALEAGIANEKSRKAAGNNLFNVVESVEQTKADKMNKKEDSTSKLECDVSSATVIKMECDADTNECSFAYDSSQVFGKIGGHVENSNESDSVVLGCIDTENQARSLAVGDSVVGERPSTKRNLEDKFDSVATNCMEKTTNAEDIKCDVLPPVIVKNEDGIISVDLSNSLLDKCPSESQKMVPDDKKGKLAQSSSQASIHSNSLSDSPTTVHFSRSPTPVDIDDTEMSPTLRDDCAISPMPLPDTDSTKTRLEDEISLASTISAVDPNYRADSPKYLKHLIQPEVGNSTENISDDTSLNKDINETAQSLLFLQQGPMLSMSKSGETSDDISGKTEPADNEIPNSENDCGAPGNSENDNKPIIKDDISGTTNKESEEMSLTTGEAGVMKLDSTELKEEEEFEEVFPEIGTFELVVYDVESLRQIIAKMAEAEDNDADNANKPKLGTQRHCVVDLHNRLTYLLQELEPWEQKLAALHKKALIKMKKEQETYTEEPEKEIEDVWESEESVSESSDNEESEEEEQKVETKVEESAEAETIGVTTRGGFKRKKKPPESDSAKKKKTTEVKEPSVSPNILQKKTTSSAHPTLKAALGGLKLTAQQGQGASIAFIGNQPILLHPNQLSGLKLAQLAPHTQGSQHQFALLSTSGSSAPMLLTTQNPALLPQKPIQVIPTTHIGGSAAQLQKAGTQRIILGGGNHPLLLTGNQSLVVGSQSQLNMLPGNRPPLVVTTTASTSLHSISSSATEPSSSTDSSKAAIPCFNYSNISQLPAQVVQQLLKTQEQRIQQQGQSVSKVITTTDCSIGQVVTSSIPTAFTKLLQAGILPGTTTTHVTAPSGNTLSVPDACNVSGRSDGDDVVMISPSPDDGVGMVTLSCSLSTVSDLAAKPLISQPVDIGSTSESAATTSTPAECVVKLTITTSSMPTTVSLATSSKTSKITQLNISPKMSQKITETSISQSPPLVQPSDSVKTEIDSKAFGLLTSPQKPLKYASNVTVKTLLENKHAQQKSSSSSSTSSESSATGEEKSGTSSKPQNKSKPNILSPSKRGPVKIIPTRKVQLVSGAAGQVQLLKAGGQQLIVQKAAGQVQVGKPQLVQGAGGQLHLVQGGGAAGQVVQLVQTSQGQHLQVIQGAQQPHIQVIQTPTGQKLHVVHPAAVAKPINQQQIQTNLVPTAQKPLVEANTDPLPVVTAPNQQQMQNISIVNVKKPLLDFKNEPGKLVNQQRQNILVAQKQPTERKTQFSDSSSYGEQPGVSEQKPRQLQVQTEPSRLSANDILPKAAEAHKVIISSTVSTLPHITSTVTSTIPKAPKPKLLHVGASGQKVIPLTPQVAAQLQISIAKKQAIDEAVKTVITSVITSLPTANIKVSSPFEMPSRHPHRPVTVTTPAMKAPIPAAKKSEGPTLGSSTSLAAMIPAAATHVSATVPPTIFPPIQHAFVAALGRSTSLMHQPAPQHTGTEQLHLSLGQPHMSLGQPQMSFGQPQMSLVQPHMSLGQPLMSLGQPQKPQMSLGQPDMSLGQPQMSLEHSLGEIKLSHLGQSQAVLGEPQAVLGEPQAVLGEPQAVLGQPQAVLGQPQAVLGQSQAVLVEPQAVFGQLQSVLGEPQAVLGQPQAVLGQSQAVLGQPQTVLGKPQTVIGQPQAVLGQPQAVLGQTQAVVGQPQAVVGQPQSVLGQPQAVQSQISNIVRPAAPVASSTVQVNNQELKTPQKNIGLRLTPQSIMTSKGAIQGVIIPAGVILSEAVLQQLKVLSYTQGLSVFLQTKTGSLQLMLTGLKAGVTVQPSVLQKLIVQDQVLGQKSTTVPLAAAQHLAQKPDAISEPASQLLANTPLQSAPQLGLAQTQTRQEACTASTSPVHSQSQNTTQLGLAQSQLQQEPQPISSPAIATAAAVQASMQMATQLGLVQTQVEHTTQETQSLSVPLSAPVHLQKVAQLISAPIATSQQSLPQMILPQAVPIIQSSLPQETLHNLSTRMKEITNLSTTHSLTTGPAHKLITQVATEQQKTAATALPSFQTSHSTAVSLRPSNQLMNIHGTAVAQPLSVTPNQVMSAQQLVELPTGQAPAGPTKIPKVALAQTLKQAVNVQQVTPKIVSPLGLGIVNRGEDNQSDSIALTSSTVSSPGVQTSSVLPALRAAPTRQQPLTQHELLQLVPKQQQQLPLQKAQNSLAKLVEEKPALTPPVNLIRGSTPNQPSKLVVFNVNGKLMTAQGVPVNLTQGLVKVGNQVIGAQAGIKAQQTADQVKSTVVTSTKPTEEMSRSAAVGGLQMLAGAASLTSVQLGQGDSEMPSGLQVLANAAKMSADTTMATER